MPSMPLAYSREIIEEMSVILEEHSPHSEACAYLYFLFLSNKALLLQPYNNNFNKPLRYVYGARVFSFSWMRYRWCAVFSSVSA